MPISLCSFTGPANAAIDNIVTVTGTSPGGKDDVKAEAKESVTLAKPDPLLKVSKVADRKIEVGVGEVVTYTYTVYNAGNVTLYKINLADKHEGTGATPEPKEEKLFEDNNFKDDSKDDVADGVWQVLAPGDAVQWQATYTVTYDDVINNGNGDGTIENTAVVRASHDGGEIEATATESIDLVDPKPQLVVEKTADKKSGVIAGDIITYTYSITNAGNVPILNISLADSHNASGPAPVPSLETLISDGGIPNDSKDGVADGKWDYLGVKDTITFQATYTVTQSDMDSLQ